MKTLLAIFAICFSLNSVAEGLETIELNFVLDDREAFEFGFPEELFLDQVKVKPELFGETTVRMIGSARMIDSEHQQDFDLVRKIKFRGHEGDKVEVEATIWRENIGGEACGEEILKKISLTFKVSKSTLKTSEHDFKATRYYTYDNCHMPYRIKEFSYSLMK